ncbi:L,D-transpeptidase family protein [Thermoflexus sp.]|uniref:L,D-transpeptidase n=1 Tax=Thermoflexus sp. TaxID=1969742 RepID=UPI0035E41B0A
MRASSRRLELQALCWAQQALRAASPEEALWWTAQAYAAAPTAPAIRAVVRRIRRRFPNGQGRPPRRWPRWVIRVGFIYGLFVLMAVALVAWGLGVFDLYAFVGGEQALTSERDARGGQLGAGQTTGEETSAFNLGLNVSVDPTSQDPGVPIPAASLEGAVPTPTSLPPTWEPSRASSPTAPAPTLTPSPLPTRTPSPYPAATALPRLRPTPSRTPIPGPPFPGRWILVDLSDQEMIAYEADTPVLRTKVSTGRPRTPTVVGTFRIYLKLRSQTMTGPGYRLPNVPYVMYFYRGYALHGTYWHNNFGRPMSHGCVNLPTPIAEQLYQWADVGTPVVVQP